MGKDNLIQGLKVIYTRWKYLLIPNSDSCLQPWSFFGVNHQPTIINQQEVIELLKDVPIPKIKEGLVVVL